MSRKKTYTVNLDIEAVKTFKKKFTTSSMSAVLNEALIAYNDLGTNVSNKDK